MTSPSPESEGLRRLPLAPAAGQVGSSLTRGVSSRSLWSHQTLALMGFLSALCLTKSSFLRDQNQRTPRVPKPPSLVSAAPSATARKGLADPEKFRPGSSGSIFASFGFQRLMVDVPSEESTLGTSGKVLPAYLV